MPLYVYKCLYCDRETEVLRRMDRRLDRVECKCGNDMALDIRAPHVNVVESMVERLNRNWKKRQEKKAKGELVE